MTLFRKKPVRVQLQQAPTPRTRSRSSRRGLFALVETFFYAVGRLVLSPGVVVGHALERVWLWFVRDTTRTFADVGSRFERLELRSSRVSLALFLCFVVVAGVGMRGVVLLADGVALKGLLVGQAQDAVRFMEQGKNQLLKEEYVAAGSAFEGALERFASARTTLEGSDALIKTLLHGTSYGKDGERLIAAGQSAGQAAVALGQFLEATKQFSFGAEGLVPASPVLSFVLVAERFSHVKRYVSEVAVLLEQVDPNHIPTSYAETFRSLQGQLYALRGAVDTLDTAIRLVARFASGDQHILVLLQNSNELRPSGGFLGTYGAIGVSNGRIREQVVSSIYDLDGQLKPEYQPPVPVRAVNDRWYMRDANWFASFPESAAAVSGMYASVTNNTPDLVIAITPEIAVQGLALTGPIQVPGYDTPLDADNFVEVTQVETSVSYDRSENKPKKMLGVFLPIFLDKLAHVAKAEPSAFLQYLTQALSAKDILLYAPAADAQGLIAELGFGGVIVPTSRDYVSVVSANLGGTKTDLSVEQDAQLTTHVDVDGSVTNTLRLHRRNPLPLTEGLQNKSFVRVLVPQGSELVSASGFSVVDVGTSEAKREMHPQVEEWQKHAVTTLSNGTIVGTEAGKTFFGNWIVLQGGEEATVEMVWKLPFRISSLDRYSLIVQKQAGAVPFVLRQVLEIPGRRVLWATQEVPAVGGVSQEWEITRDVFFGAVLGVQ